MGHFSPKAARLAAVIAWATVSMGASAESHTRHADAHIHGEGGLNFAIEGNQIYLELKTPGFDILGFETITTEEQHHKLEEAYKQLGSADLWRFTPAASCKLVEAKIPGAENGHAETHNEHGHDEHHAEKHDEHEHDEHHAQKPDEHDESQHMDIEATYVYQCSDIKKLNSLGTTFFTTFPNSEELKIQGIAPKGQVFSHLTQDKPEVRF
ncbi:DUF2796 domain-containing protein [Parendozoicomonas sp. Alg238-R29]|uniref:ZrgA family zinc uptake protein n=1 Tax=Parendozoicomonas sp. Alg238-R29 TaxID=2993446 RepID=UPI00248DA9B9|nr:DUF2796 domain-containing protein [Parendozoicomonas sp. Alg238-R29]